MKIKWYGHAAFLITSDRGVKIMTDPYDPDAYAEKLTKPRVKRLEVSETTFHKAHHPQQIEIVILNHAL